MTKVTIESGIPLPKDARLPDRGSLLTPPLKALAAANIGDSIVMTGCSKSAIYTRATIIGGPGWIAMKPIDQRSFRVWKKADPGEPKPRRRQAKLQRFKSQ